MLWSPERMQWAAWAMTLALEGGGAAAVWLVARITRPPLRRVLYTVLAVNALSHPLFWLSLRRLPAAGPQTVLLGEVVVTAAEAAAYAGLLALSPSRSLALSLGLNALSWWSGGILWPLLLRP